MPPRRGRSRPPFRRPGGTRPTGQSSGRIQFTRRNVPLSHASIVLQPVGSVGDVSEVVQQWELVCRDGWEWRRTGQSQVAARVAVISGMQAPVVREWIERLRDPEVWWAVSRELAAPESSPHVAAALRTSPWLAQVFPVLLEASVDGSPPPPTAAAASAESSDL
jgi:hypothetical protein